MQQFVLEEHIDILSSKDRMEVKELMDLARDEFMTSMLRIHQANSVENGALWYVAAPLSRIVVRKVFHCFDFLEQLRIVATIPLAWRWYATRTKCL